MKTSILLKKLFDIKYKNKKLYVYFCKYKDEKTIYISAYHQESTYNVNKNIKYIRL